MVLPGFVQVTLWNLTLQGLDACPFMAQNNDGEGNGDGQQSRASTSSENKSKKTQIRMDLEPIQDSTRHKPMLSN